MYEWITEIEKPIYPYKEESGELGIQSFQSNTSLDKISPIFHLFASVNVIFNQDFLSSFPAPNSHALNIIHNEIVPHYSEVRQIFIDEKLICEIFERRISNLIMGLTLIHSLESVNQKTNRSISHEKFLLQLAS